MYIVAFEAFSTFTFFLPAKEKYESLVSHFWTTSHATLLASDASLLAGEILDLETQSLGPPRLAVAEALKQWGLYFFSSDRLQMSKTRQLDDIVVPDSATRPCGVGGAVPTLAAPTVSTATRRERGCRAWRYNCRQSCWPLWFAYLRECLECLLPPTFTMTNLLTMNVRQAPYTKMSARSSLAATEGYNPIELFDAGWPVAKELQNTVIYVLFFTHK